MARYEHVAGEPTCKATIMVARWHFLKGGAISYCWCYADGYPKASSVRCLMRCVGRPYSRVSVFMLADMVGLVGGRTHQVVVSPLPYFYAWHKVHCHGGYGVSINTSTTSEVIGLCSPHTTSQDSIWL